MISRQGMKLILKNENSVVISPDIEHFRVFKQTIAFLSNQDTNLLKKIHF